nr:amidohydrolase [Thermoanaerobaculia bacterium]
MFRVCNRTRSSSLTLLVLAFAAMAPPALAQEPSTDPRPAPPRAEGEGPFERLVIRNATVIDGTGAPAGGP